MTLDYDILVIGGGHAGCEAASAAARMGSRTLLLTMDMTKLANMSCNPAVGGVAKGQIVREIDALGGRTARITDRTTLQFRMLNRSKGAAMWSPRAQCDKGRFSAEWRHELENTQNLYIWQDTAAELLFDTAGERPRVTGVRTCMGVEFTARAVILTAGTFLDGMMYCGEAHAPGGRAGDPASTGITASLAAMGFETGRMKTGTPARLDARTIDFEALEPQYGDENPLKFSFSTDTQPVKHQSPCFLVYTSPEVHATLRTGFDRSPLFNGTIHGIGPRYCPSIEDKLRTFADKEQHQLFLEPEGDNTNEYYLNGFSSSLPWEVQYEALHRIRGLEDVHIFRPGYAIEYDYFPPTQLRHTLETKLVDGLYFAGQVNGTTGYEEAAAQGLLAGINAHRKRVGESAIVLQRDEAYIGVLIDDLVTKGVDEPYRMFTSRAEYRLLLNHSSAEIRLLPYARRLGLLARGRERAIALKSEAVRIWSGRLDSGRAGDSLRRGENAALPAGFLALPPEARAEILYRVAYKGYLERDLRQIEKMSGWENIRIPSGLDYSRAVGLRLEARQKLEKFAPSTIGQASRISGVSPADIGVLLVYVKSFGG